ncbi:conserved hypothetical protein [Mucor ambiguus]|uniref:1-phosphatidylinositol-3-phosphate 5-kinase n=1 Tax=Mucor ambiguus TaxID=91626 RepID=A0A0C9M922_9FUNG|nr:conserved hypothetical protein [Mucor ambiguus]
MDKQRKSSLTSFNLQTPEDTVNEEGVLSKIFDKVLHAVAGGGGHSSATSEHGYEGERDPQQRLPHSISANSSLSKHLTTASSSTTLSSPSTTTAATKENFSVLDSVAVPRSSRSTTTATTATTVTVGNQKLEPTPPTTLMQPNHHASNATNTVQFIVPPSSHDASSGSHHDTLDDLLQSSPIIAKRRSIDSDTQSVVTNFSISNSNSLSKILARLRGQKNDKEFWMPDEQCQIFCGRCASHVISGKLFKQKGQVRVCNFCYAEQLLQLEHENTSMETLLIPPPPPPPPLPPPPTILVDQQQQLQPPIEQPSSTSTSIIPSQKPPLAVPQMQIPTTALKQARSTYGNDNATTFALEIPIRGSESYIANAVAAASPIDNRPWINSAIDAFTATDSLPHHTTATTTSTIPTITTTNSTTTDTGGLKRLFDAGTMLLKSTTTSSSSPSRPRSNTSSSAPMEDTRVLPFPQTPMQLAHHPSPWGPFSPYLDRGGGTVLAESELSPFPGNHHHHINGSDFYQDQLHHHHHPHPPTGSQSYHHAHYHPHPPSQLVHTISAAANSSPMAPPSPLMMSKSSALLQQTSHVSRPPNDGLLGMPLSSNVTAAIGSDDESYDHRLRIKRTEELRGMSSGRSSFQSMRRLSLTGSSSSGGGGTGTSVGAGTSSKKLMRHGSSKIRINTMNLPKGGGDEGSPLASPYMYDINNNNTTAANNESTATLWTMNRLRFPPRQRRLSGPPQIVELSFSARTHARTILRQLMQDITLTYTTKEAWEEVIMNILLKVTNHVQPDIRAGDDMDVRHYVKIKKIPGGVPSDSFYVKGVVCTKNVAHKRMLKNMSHPRILILMFSLDYSRVEMENQLLSIAPVISQEREHIRKLVGRIVALKPSLLLVKSTVSRLALEFLLEANIPVVHNVKHSVLEAIARCTQASIVTSVDKLQHGLSFGRCGSFEIRTVMHEWLPNRRKTFLIFDDCAPELGGTIVLRGEKVETLRVIKRLVDFMVFVVNNLKLETSLLLDSFAKNRGAASCDDAKDDSSRHRSPLISVAASGNMTKHCCESVISMDEEDGQTVNAHYISDLLKLYQNTVLSVSQFVVFPPPYLLLALKETEDKLALIHQQKRRKSVSGSSVLTNATTVTTTAVTIRDTVPPAQPPLSASPTKSTFEKQHIDACDDVYDLIAKNHQISRAWDAYIGENPESISPFYHQNIVVLYSSVCTVTTVPCQGPEIRIFGFYRYPSDKTLGQYVVDLCNDARQPCSSFMCDHPMLQHYRSYAHGNARVNVMIEPFPCPLPGMSDKLLMWNYCKECNKPTPVLPMSDNTWNYSFGKFLEIFLYQQGVYCRADICPHDMARHHVRYFGYNDLTVRFQYDPIDLLEVAAPPMKLLIKSQVQMDIKEGELKSLRSKINKFYQSIIERNKAFPYDLVDPRKLEICKAELQDMSLEAQGEKKDALQLVQNVYATSDPIDTLTINIVRRNLFQVVAHWDAVYADFVQFYLQPERELKKITATQFRKMFPTDDASAIHNMDNERTKRATEVTDLPLLGIGLDGEDDDALIGHILKRGRMPAAQPKQVMMPVLSGTPSSGSPPLLVTMDTTETDHQDPAATVQPKQQSIDPDHKHSFLEPELRRRLSLELMHELNEKFKSNEDDQQHRPTGLLSLNRMASNKYLRVKSPGALSAAFTPSRIPIPRQLRQQQQQQNDVVASSMYENFHRFNHLGNFDPPRLDSNYLQYHHRNSSSSSSKRASSSSKGKQVMDRKGMHSGGARVPDRYRHRRHHSIGHSQHLPTDHEDEDEDISSEATSFLRRSATTRASRTKDASPDRRFRSRLPRKKTYIQVYTQANDLVKEDMEDEFGGGGGTTTTAGHTTTGTHNAKRQLHRKQQLDYFTGRRRDTYAPTRFYQDNGMEADDDDDDMSEDSTSNSSSDKDDMPSIDYFSSLAPYASEVVQHGLPEGAPVEEPISLPADPLSPSSPQRPMPVAIASNHSLAKPYFPFSDGQMDLSSGMSGDDDTDRDLPSASELLKIQQPSAEDANVLSGLHNLHPDMLLDSVAEGVVNGKTLTENLDDLRHSAEKISFMKTLTNFLTDSGVGNLLPLESPLQPTEYLFPDSYVIVREDEPSSIIAYTLSSEDYIDKMHDIQDCSSAGDQGSNEGTIKPGDTSIRAPSEVTTLDNTLVNSQAPNNTTNTNTDDIQETLLRESGTHMRYNFSTGSTKFFCKIFFSEQFDALRRNCGCDESYIMSLANCIKWDSSGGKSGSAFLKTKDDRLLMKQMSRYELDAFLGFAPAYFQYMSEAFFSELPTVLAKIFGFYSIGYKNSATGKSMRMDVLVMENLFYQRNIFDLKGSMRNRHVQSTGKQDEVLLDENLVELIYQSPLFIRAHSKEILRSSLHNDTLFLSNRNVMDYSLLVGIDEERQELVVGIVDFIRTFTWDKKLESWVKESGILGGGGKGPTIVSPRQYRIRFREAMERYFLMVPDFWALTRQSRTTYSALHNQHSHSESEEE